MSLFHRHHWTEVSRTFTSPVEGNFGRARGPRAIAIIERATQGFTCVELRCSGCGDIRHRTVLGCHLVTDAAAGTHRIHGSVRFGAPSHGEPQT